jgi:DNA-binding MarR family transcriptional regulator
LLALAHRCKHGAMTDSDPMQSGRPIEEGNPLDVDVGKLEAVLAGARQYAELLESPDSISIAIMLTLWQAQHLQTVANLRAFDALNLPTTINGSRLTILRTLYFAEQKCMSMGAISKATGVSPTMVTNLVDGLARGGLVKRVGNPEDRRVSLVHLTEEGEEAFRRILPVMSARMQEACKRFTDEEKTQLLSLLQKFL